MHANTIYFIFFTFLINFCCCIKYNNYTLYRGIPVEASHLKFFENLTSMFNVNFWRHPGLLYKPVDFIISPDDKDLFVNRANNLGLYVTTIMEDVQQAFDMQTVKTYIRREMDSFDWNNFFRLGDIYEWLNDLAQVYPQEMELHSIGKTHENRDIMAVKILLRGSRARSKVIVEGGIHAREWISPAFVTYLISQIIHAPVSPDPNLKMIANTYEWHFVPVLNPDGYEYSHTEDRLWRKNRHGGQAGVDLNRNFGHSFGTVGVSWRKNAQTYCGPFAFSEKESSAMAKFVRSHGQSLEYYLAFHSYGQYMIVPYADRKDHVDNYDELMKMCLQAKKRIAAKYNTQYTIGTAYDTVGYMTSGVSGCWVKQEFRVPAFDAQLYSRKKRSTSNEIYWTNYQTIEDIYNWFNHLASTQSSVSTFTVGRSHEGRNITGIKITRGSGTRAFFLQAGELGADWLSPTIVTYIANQLIHSNDPEIKAAAEDFTWYILPLVNPDGFQFSQDYVRTWVKNRRPTSSSTIGVNLSRNWNAHWGINGASFSMAANNYAGHGPFSEAETRAVSEFMDTIRSSLTGFLSFRSFGQRLLVPYAQYSVNPSGNYNSVVTIGRRAMGSLAVRYNTQYLVGTSTMVHDGATGAIADWVKFRYNATIAATYLLRDTGFHGYALPVTQIIPSGEETFDSLLAIIREARFINVL
ncbi:zinc carboxypeptidase A 1-like [Trichoplusia ni]|uniref:Zinc carboxypeptidase A 1-like n=1 Tax=Trichoplusia ni TaxID=7111 RepID=A0A7E5WRL8_TRINI|nr:zinc carboxypeptidase A 1-like [Trichoplusia ni]